MISAHAPEVAAIEAFFVHPVSKAAMGMAAARGALLVSCAQSGLAVAAAIQALPEAWRAAA